MGSNKRTCLTQSGDSARLPFIIVITFLVRGKNCLLKINPRCSRSNTKLMESVPLRDRNCLRDKVCQVFLSSSDRQMWLCQ